jgi:hypothetical protein
MAHDGGDGGSDTTAALLVCFVLANTCALVFFMVSGLRADRQVPGPRVQENDKACVPERKRHGGGGGGHLNFPGPPPILLTPPG